MLKCGYSSGLHSLLSGSSGHFMLACLAASTNIPGNMIIAISLQNIELASRSRVILIIMTYQYNVENFTKEDAISFYLLGAFCTDGCMSANQFIINSKDRDWLNDIRNLICPNIKIGQSKVSNCYSLQFTNKYIYAWLVKHGCRPRKSLRLRLPDIPQEYLFDFVRGCLDGDGSISTYQASKKRGTKTYTNFKS